MAGHDRLYRDHRSGAVFSDDSAAEEKAEGRRKHAQQRADRDEIITIGGFYGRVISIKEDALTIESPVDHSKQNIAKWAVQTNLTVHEEPAADKKAVKAKSDKADKAKKEDKAN